MDERKRGKKSLSSPTPKLQCRSQLTDREEEEEDGGGDEAFTVWKMDLTSRGLELQLKMISHERERERYPLCGYPLK